MKGYCLTIPSKRPILGFFNFNFVLIIIFAPGRGAVQKELPILGIKYSKLPAFFKLAEKGAVQTL